jgi:EAL domain-containing protein (putative c-di-GMP-specific phosphodiesterase class I)
LSALRLIDRLARPGALRTFAQPIVALAEPQVALAYEVLTRGPVGSTLESAGVLFEYVRRMGREQEFDRLCVEGGFELAASLPASVGLSVNVHAATLERDADFVDFLLRVRQTSGSAARPLVVELVEHVPTWHGPRLLQALARLRAAGVAIALDDVGSGHSTLRLLLELRPEIVKLDRWMVQGCAADPARRVLIAALVRLASGLGASLVAEGVESEADLRALAAEGVERAQGYLLGRPREWNRFAGFWAGTETATTRELAVGR